MRFAIAQALLGKGLTSPNPVVGAVLVKNGRILPGDTTMPRGFPTRRSRRCKKPDFLPVPHHPHLFPCAEQPFS